MRGVRTGNSGPSDLSGSPGGWRCRGRARPGADSLRRPLPRTPVEAAGTGLTPTVSVEVAAKIVFQERPVQEFRWPIPGVLLCHMLCGCPPRLTGLGDTRLAMPLLAYGKPPSLAGSAPSEVCQLPQPRGLTT